MLSNLLEFHGLVCRRRRESWYFSPVWNLMPAYVNVLMFPTLNNALTLWLEALLHLFTSTAAGAVHPLQLSAVCSILHSYNPWILSKWSSRLSWVAPLNYLLYIKKNPKKQYLPEKKPIHLSHSSIHPCTQVKVIEVRHYPRLGEEKVQPWVLGNP